MKTARILLTFALATAVVLPLKAADKPAKRGKLSPVTQAFLRMHTFHQALEGIELSEEQQAQVKKLHEELGPKMEAVFGKIKGVLTEEQQQAAEAAAKAAKEAGKEGRDFFLAVQESVKLTPEQENQMEEIAKQLRALQRDVIKKSLAVLTDEQKEQLKAKHARRGGKKGNEGKKTE